MAELKRIILLLIADIEALEAAFGIEELSTEARVVS